MKLKVSIITAGFNSEKTIKDTLDCIASQSYSNIEHLIIDGGSSDNTLPIVSKYPHVSKVISEPDKGIYDAMNKGIKNSTGEVIGILNSDDFYVSSSVLEEVMNVFSNPKVKAVYGDLVYVHPENTTQIIRKWWSGKYELENWRFGWMPPHPTFFVRKELYEKYGNFRLDLKSAADYELMLRFCYKQKIIPSYIPKTLVKMRSGGMSNASLKNRLKANKEDIKAWLVNELKPPVGLGILKPLRKVSQWIK